MKDFTKAKSTVEEAFRDLATLHVAQAADAVNAAVGEHGRFVDFAQKAGSAKTADEAINAFLAYSANAFQNVTNEAMKAFEARNNAFKAFGVKLSGAFSG